MIDYYQEFSLDPSASSEELRKELSKQKRRWMQRQNAPDLAMRQKAEQKTALIDEAITIFADNLKRDDYDRRLRREHNRKTAQVEEQECGQDQQNPQVRPREPERMTDDQILTELSSLYENSDPVTVINRGVWYLNKGYQIAEIYYFLGRSYKENDQYNEAIDALKTGLGISIGDEKELIYSELATIYLFIYKDGTEAERYINSAKEIDPDNFGLLKLEIYKLLMERKFNDAQMLVNYKLGEYPNNTELKKEIASACTSYGYSFMEVAEDGREYVENQQVYDTVLYWLNQSFTISGDNESASELEEWKTKSNLTFNSDNIPAVILLGLLCFLTPIFLIFFVPIAAFSIKKKWEVEKMQITRKRDIVNNIAYGASYAAKIVWKLILILISMILGPFIG